MSESKTESPMPPIAVLCGGLASRLRPLTTTVPKSMLTVAGEPFIAHQLRLLVQAGFQDVVLLCGFLGQEIEDFVQTGSRFGCSVAYSYDGPELLGTGGAVRCALPLLGSEFMLIYGDSYCATNYRNIYRAYQGSGLPALMTVFHNKNQWDKSNVEYRDHRIVRYDKNAYDEGMTFIDYGVSVFQAQVFAREEAGKAFDLAGVQRDLVATGRLAGYQVQERFYEIGSATGLAETDAYLARIPENAASFISKESAQ